MRNVLFVVILSLGISNKSHCRQFVYVHKISRATTVICLKRVQEFNSNTNSKQKNKTDKRKMESAFFFHLLLLSHPSILSHTKLNFHATFCLQPDTLSLLHNWHMKYFGDFLLFSLWFSYRHSYHFSSEKKKSYYRYYLYLAFASVRFVSIRFVLDSSVFYFCFQLMFNFDYIIHEFN